MGQREDVRASLLASRGVDEVARRKVADDVREVVVVAAGDVGVATAHATSLVERGKGQEAHALVQASLKQAATAASAVVLASDLRAPEDGHVFASVAEMVESYGPPDANLVGLAEPDTVAPKTGETIANGQFAYPTNQDPPDDTMAELAAAHEIAKAFVWVADRESLVRVERLLAEAVEKLPDDLNRRYLIEPALSIVRSLLGGE